MSQIAEDNVFTLRGDTGLQRPDVARYDDIVYIAVSTVQAFKRQVIISCQYTDPDPICFEATGVVAPQQPRYDFTSQAQWLQFQASWNLREFSDIDRLHVASLTRATNPTSTQISSAVPAPESSIDLGDIPGEEITLAEARELAFQVLEDAERDLQQERAAEARFLMNLWEDDDT